MRKEEVDKYIESVFGKPDWSKTKMVSGMMLTPMIGNNKLFRVDELLNHGR
jgi:hypothetical protein